MSEANPAKDELDALRRDIDNIDVAMKRKVQEDGSRVAHLVEEAKNTPTPREAELEAQNQKLLTETQELRAALEKAEADRDDFKKQRDDLAPGIHEERFNLRKTLEKHGIKLAVVAMVLFAGLLALRYPHPYVATHQPQLASAQVPPAGFPQGPVILT